MLDIENIEWNVEEAQGVAVEPPQEQRIQLNGMLTVQQVDHMMQEVDRGRLYHRDDYRNPIQWNHNQFRGYYNEPHFAYNTTVTNATNRMAAPIVFGEQARADFAAPTVHETLLQAEQRRQAELRDQQLAARAAEVERARQERLAAGPPPFPGRVEFVNEGANYIERVERYPEGNTLRMVDEEGRDLPTLLAQSNSDAVSYTERLSRAIRKASPKVWEALTYYGQKNGKGDYLDIAGDGQISWRPLERMNDITTPYDVKGRIKGKPAKSLKAFLGQYGLGYLNAKDWEEFANRFMAQQNAKTAADGFQLLSGEDLVEAYNERNHTFLKTVRPLAHSCMRYASCQPMLDIYGANPNQVKLLVEYDEEGQVVARALVWTTEKNETFLDRIYGDNKSIEAFQTYAQEKGWWYRAYNSYNNPTTVVIDNEHKKRMRRVVLENKPTTGQFPYCDTFLYYAPDENVLSNDVAGLKKFGRTVQLRRTDGGYYDRRANGAFYAR